MTEMLLAASSPAATPVTVGLRELPDLESPATDTHWTWGQHLLTTLEPTFPVKATSLPEWEQSGRLARLAFNALTDAVDLLVSVPVTGASTITSSTGLTVGDRFASDWAAIVPWLLGLRRPEYRWMVQRTMTAVTEVVSSVTPELPEATRELETGFVPKAAPELTADASRHPGLRALDDLRRWLVVSLSDVARISGVAESTIYWWREHPNSVPRPAKIDRLLGLHALVGGMVDELGEARARRWFRAGDPPPLDRLRAGPEALADIETEGYELLLRQARKRLAAAGPGRPVTDEDDRRDLARLAEQERAFREPLEAEELDPSRLEPDDLG